MDAKKACRPGDEPDGRVPFFQNASYAMSIDPDVIAFQAKAQFPSLSP
jgi:hypothetical protein